MLLALLPKGLDIQNLAIIMVLLRVGYNFAYTEGPGTRDLRILVPLSATGMFFAVVEARINP